MNTTRTADEAEANGAVHTTKKPVASKLRSSHTIAALFVLVFLTFFFNGCTGDTELGGSPVHSLGFPLAYYTTHGSETIFNPVALLINTILFIVIAWFRTPILSSRLVSLPLLPLILTWFMTHTLPAILPNTVPFWLQFPLYAGQSISLVPLTMIGLNTSVPSLTLAIGAQAFIVYYVLIVATAYAIERFTRTRNPKPS
jgi:hypothetical protein